MGKLGHSETVTVVGSSEAKSGQLTMLTSACGKSINQSILRGISSAGQSDCLQVSRGNRAENLGNDLCKIEGRVLGRVQARIDDVLVPFLVVAQSNQGVMVVTEGVSLSATEVKQHIAVDVLDEGALGATDVGEGQDA